MSYIIKMADRAAQEAQTNIEEASKQLRKEANKLASDRTELRKDIDQWKKDKRMLHEKSAFGLNVTLDVGGVTYRVSRMTLTQNIPRSHMLATMFSGLHPPDEKEASGVFFIDRNGKVFEHILEYLRNGSPAIFKFRLEAEPQRSIILYQLHEEAKYFQIPDLINDIRMLVGIDNLGTLKQVLVPHANFTVRNGNTRLNSNANTWKIDYGEKKDQEMTTVHTYQTDFVYIRGKNIWGCQCTQWAFNDNSIFKLCDFSAITFKQCYFGPKVSFTGSVLFGTKFEECAGLIENKVRFSSKQIMESEMTEDLVEALREAKCVYDEPPEIATD